MENVRNHRDIKLITAKASRTYLVSESNIIMQQHRCQTKKTFSDKLLKIEMKRTEMLMNKPAF